MSKEVNYENLVEITISNNKSYFYTSNLNKKAIAAFFKAIRYRVKNWEHTEAAGRGWDGWNYLSDLESTPSGLFHKSVGVGLLPRILQALINSKCPFNIINRRKKPHHTPNIQPAEYLQGVVLRDYQNMMVDSITKDIQTESLPFYHLVGEDVNFLRSGLEFETEMPDPSIRLPGIGIWCAATGCHRKGQEVLMYDGSIKRVEDVTVGDTLMGPDNSPRKVYSLCRGSQDMVEIIPTKGDPFVVNLDHILSLQRTRKHIRDTKAGEIVDVSVREWLSWSKTKKHLYKLYRVSVEHFENQIDNFPIDPYFMGLLLSDECLTRTSVGVYKKDVKIIEELKTQAEIWGMSLYKGKSKHSITYRFSSGNIGGKPNLLTQEIRKLGLFGLKSVKKFIPKQYLLSSFSSRLELLAGLLDTEGSLSGTFYYITDSQQLATDVLFLSRSLGFAAYMKKVKKKWKNGERNYFHISISGSLEKIPTRILRKQAVPRSQKKDVLVTGFSICFLGEEDYYGFSLSGDGRYLLSDFTVTHNSGKTIASAALIGKLALRSCFLVFGDALVDQTYNRFDALLGRWLAENDLHLGLVLGGKFNPGEITIVATSTIDSMLNRPSRLQTQMCNTLKKLQTLVQSSLHTTTYGIRLHESYLKHFISWKNKLVSLINKANLLEYDRSFPMYQNFDRDNYVLVTPKKEDEFFSTFIIPPAPIPNMGVKKSKRSQTKKDNPLTIKDIIDQHGTDHSTKLPTIGFLEGLYRKELNDLAAFPQRYRKAIKRKEEALQFIDKQELVILDEAHTGGTDNMLRMLSLFKNAYYRIAMSGTPLNRSDGANIKIISNFGEIIARVTNEDMMNKGVIPPTKIIMLRVETPIRMSGNWRWEDLYQKGIAFHSGRNGMIVQIIKQSLLANKSILAIFTSIEQGNLLSALLSCEKNHYLVDANPEYQQIIDNILEGNPIPHEKVDGGSNLEERSLAVAHIENRINHVLLASEIFGTGMDLPSIDCLINISGSKSVIPVKQRLGRGLRGTMDTYVFDFADGQHKNLAKQSLERLTIYKKESCFTIVNGGGEHDILTSGDSILNLFKSTTKS